MYEPSDLSCCVCLERNESIDTSIGASINVLSICLPEITWLAEWHICKLCEAQVNLIKHFRERCLHSYKKLTQSKQTSVDYQKSHLQNNVNNLSVIKDETIYDQSRSVDDSINNRLAADNSCLINNSDNPNNDKFELSHDNVATICDKSYKTNLNHIIKPYEDGLVEDIGIVDTLKVSIKQELIDTDLCENVEADTFMDSEYIDVKIEDQSNLIEEEMHLDSSKDTTKIIDKNINKSMPLNTFRSKRSVWTQFEKFCIERKYDITSKKMSIDKINVILKDWGYNMKKSDGISYKESVVKAMWNSVAKQFQELYLNKFKIRFDPLRDVEFADSRSARDSHCRKLQLHPKFRKSSEIHRLANLYDENTPDGLQKNFFYIACHELGWSRLEATSCLITCFKEEFDDNGLFTGRIEYNQANSKIFQGRTKKRTDSQWLNINEENPSVCPVRILRKLLSKRKINIDSQRLFLRPNHNWDKSNPDSFWYINSPIGKNTIYTWKNRRNLQRF